jgi:predicted enzyme related to lactoylglutathione lyase
MTESKPTFIWYELMTSDPDAAAKFYGAVVGWKTSDAGQPDMRYTILSVGDRGVGGLMAIPAEAARAGARPVWLGYVGVPDTDDAAKRIVEAGGTLHHAPENIPNVGRFAVVADPGGAMFQLLTPLPREEEPAPAEPGTPGTVGWHELHSSIGQEAAFAFYSRQFGWETRELMDMGPMGKYRIFGADGVTLGGMMDKSEQMPASTWTYYVNVDGLDAAVKRIEANRGQVLMGPQEVPGGSWIIQAVDPQGASFALVSARR